MTQQESAFCFMPLDMMPECDNVYIVWRITSDSAAKSLQCKKNIIVGRLSACSCCMSFVPCRI